MQHVGDRPAGGVAAVERPAPVVKEDEFTREVRETLERTPGHAGLMRKMREAHAAYTRATGLRGDETTEMAWLVRAPLQGPDSYAILPEVFPGLHARYVKGWRSEEQLRLEDPQLHAWFRDTVAWHEQLETAVTERVPVQPLSVHGLLHPEYEIVCCARSALGIPDFDAAWLDDETTPNVYGAPDALVASLAAYTRRRVTMYDELIEREESIPTARAFAYQEITEAVLAATDALDRSGWTPWDDFPWLPSVYLNSEDTPARIVALYMTAVRTHVRVPLDEICPVAEVLRGGPFHWVFMTTLPASVDLRRDLVESGDQLRVMLEHMLWATHALLALETELPAEEEETQPRVGGRASRPPGAGQTPREIKQADLDRRYRKFIAGIAFSHLMPLVGYEPDDLTHPAMLALRQTLCGRIAREPWIVNGTENHREGMVAAADRFAERIKSMQRDLIDKLKSASTTRNANAEFNLGEIREFEADLDKALDATKQAAADSPLHRPRTVGTDVAVAMSLLMRELENMPPQEQMMQAFVTEQRVIADAMHKQILLANDETRDRFFRVASTYARERAFEDMLPKGRLSTGLCIALEGVHIAATAFSGGYSGRSIPHFIKTVYARRERFTSLWSGAMVLIDAFIEAAAVETFYYWVADWRVALIKGLGGNPVVRGYTQSWQDWWYSWLHGSETTELFRRAALQNGFNGTTPVHALANATHGTPFLVSIDRATGAQVGWVHTVPRNLDDDAQSMFRRVANSDDAAEVANATRKLAVGMLTDVADGIDTAVARVTGANTSATGVVYNATTNLVRSAVDTVTGVRDGYVVPFSKSVRKVRAVVTTVAYSALTYTTGFQALLDGDWGHQMRIQRNMRQFAMLYPTGLTKVLRDMADKATTAPDTWQWFQDRLSILSAPPLPGDKLLRLEKLDIPAPVNASDTHALAIAASQAIAMTDTEMHVVNMMTGNMTAFTERIQQIATGTTATETSTLGFVYNTLEVSIGSEKVETNNRKAVARLDVKKTSQAGKYIWNNPISYLFGTKTDGVRPWTDGNFTIEGDIAPGTFDYNGEFCGQIVSPGIAVSLSSETQALRVLHGLPDDIPRGVTLLLRRTDETGSSVKAFIQPGEAALKGREWMREIRDQLEELTVNDPDNMQAGVLLNLIQVEAATSLGYGAFRELVKATGNAHVDNVAKELYKLQNTWSADRTLRGRDLDGKEVVYTLNPDTLGEAICQKLDLAPQTSAATGLLRLLSNPATLGMSLTDLLPDELTAKIKEGAKSAVSAACTAAAHMILAELDRQALVKTIQGDQYWNLNRAGAQFTTSMMMGLIDQYMTRQVFNGLVWLWRGGENEWATTAPPRDLVPWQRLLSAVTRHCTRLFIDGGHLFSTVSNHLHKAAAEQDLRKIYEDTLRLNRKTAGALFRTGIFRGAAIGVAATNILTWLIVTDFYISLAILATTLTMGAVAHHGGGRLIEYMWGAAQAHSILASVGTVVTIVMGSYTSLSGIVGSVFGATPAPLVAGGAASALQVLPYIPIAVGITLMFSVGGFAYAVVETAVRTIDTTASVLYIERVMRVHRGNLVLLYNTKTTIIEDRVPTPVEWYAVLNWKHALPAAGASLVTGAWLGGATAFTTTTSWSALLAALNPAVPAAMLAAGVLVNGTAQFTQHLMRSGQAYGCTLSETVDVFVQLTLALRKRAIAKRPVNQRAPVRENPRTPVADGERAGFDENDEPYTLATILAAVQQATRPIETTRGANDNNGMREVVREIMARTLGLLGGSVLPTHKVVCRIQREAVAEGPWLLPLASMTSTTSRVTVVPINKPTEIRLRTADDLRALVATTARKPMFGNALQFPSDLIYRSTEEGVKWPLDPNAHAPLVQYLGGGDAVIDFMLEVIRRRPVQSGPNARPAVAGVHNLDLNDDTAVDAYLRAQQDRRPSGEMRVLAGEVAEPVLVPPQLLAAAAVYRHARGIQLSPILRTLIRQLGDGTPQQLYAQLCRHTVTEMPTTGETQRTTPIRISFTETVLLLMWQCTGVMSGFLCEWFMRAQMPSQSTVLPSRNALVLVGPGGYVRVALPETWIATVDIVVPVPLQYAALVPFASPEFIDEQNPSYNILLQSRRAVSDGFAWLRTKVGRGVGWLSGQITRRTQPAPRASVI